MTAQIIQFRSRANRIAEIDRELKLMAVEIMRLAAQVEDNSPSERNPDDCA